MMTVEIEYEIVKRLTVTSLRLQANENEKRLKDIQYKTAEYAEGFLAGYWNPRYYVCPYWPFCMEWVAWQKGFGEGEIVGLKERYGIDACDDFEDGFE